MQKISNRTILFVDDEEKILNALRRGLMEEPYQMRFVDSGEQALEILSSEPVHVIVSDMCMPGFSGLDFLKRVHQDHPDVVRIVLSGMAQSPLLREHSKECQIYRFINKPFRSIKELKTILLDAIEQYDIQCESGAISADSSSES